MNSNVKALRKLPINCLMTQSNFYLYLICFHYGSVVDSIVIQEDLCWLNSSYSGRFLLVEFLVVVFENHFLFEISKFLVMIDFYFPGFWN